MSQHPTAEFDQAMSADIGTISFDGVTEPDGCQACGSEGGP